MENRVLTKHYFMGCTPNPNGLRAVFVKYGIQVQER